MAPIRVPSQTFVPTEQKNFDFAAFKNTKFGPEDRIGLEFRAEFFNLFNRTQFNPPNTSCCGGTSFGQVTGQYNLPRVIQFAGESRSNSSRLCPGGSARPDTMILLSFRSAHSVSRISSMFWD